VYQKGGNLLAGAVVPDKFTHYSNCYCYVPNPKYPRPTMELAELELLSEYEARQELASLCIAMRKQRILYRTKEVCLKNKYEEKIRFLETQ
jgi:capsule polysaccharide modification protein KpsS